MSRSIEEMIEFYETLHENRELIKARREREERLQSNFEAAKENNLEFKAWFDQQKNSYPHFSETWENNYIDTYGSYVANNIAELPQNPYEEYQLFNEFAHQGDHSYRFYVRSPLQTLTEIKREDAEQYIQKNFSCSLDEYETQMERQKRPEQWDKFDAAKKTDPSFSAWIENQKNDLSSEIALITHGGEALEGSEAELLSRKVEAYAFYVHSACGGNIYLNPYAEHKRFAEFRNDPAYNTDRNLNDKYMLNDIARIKEEQAGVYIWKKFSCDLEEYEERREQNRYVKKNRDVGLEF